MESKKPGRTETEDRLSAVVDVEVRILFSHRPTRVKIPGFGVDARPEDNELEFVLSLATESETELPLDISWPEREGARYFTQITIRRDGVEDDVVVYSGATILGRITIGKGSVIGGNVWLLNGVPPGSKVAQNRPKESHFEDGSGI